ncbi:MAG TPA: ABC transporter ATP-binding protein [Epulopiscium sp.]|nr:ABC transporter ATP-binding protein [Candidatus Epulonipiscium sp.]
MDKDLVEIKDVDLIYLGDKEDLKVLYNINLTIKENEFICLLGPSGCGKSTLLNIIAGFVKPSVGTVELNGKAIEGPNSNRGVVFQDSVLYPWLNIYDNVSFGIRMRKFLKEEVAELTNQYLELVGLGEFRDHRPYELSGGMRQRACLARILIGNPRIILMDEPFGALDSMTRDKMQELTRKIWFKTKNTVFLITHDIDEALLLGTRVILMSPRPGKIMKEFNLDFTSKILSGSYKDIRYSKEYQDIRKEIVDTISLYQV